MIFGPCYRSGSGRCECRSQVGYCSYKLLVTWRICIWKCFKRSLTNGLVIFSGPFRMLTIAVDWYVCGITILDNMDLPVKVSMLILLSRKVAGSIGDRHEHFVSCVARCTVDNGCPQKPAESGWIFEDCFRSHLKLNILVSELRMRLQKSTLMLLLCKFASAQNLFYTYCFRISLLGVKEDIIIYWSILSSKRVYHIMQQLYASYTVGLLIW